MSRLRILRWLGLTAALVLAFSQVVEDIGLNIAYLSLLRALTQDDQRHLEQIADQLSAAVVAQPTARRRWDEALVWFRLGQYERAAAVMPPLDLAHLPRDLMVKGTRPSWEFVYHIFTAGPSPVDWQGIIGDRPPPEYLILSGVLASQNENWGEALQYYRLALAVDPQIHDGVFYQYYYQALANSSDPVDRQSADTVLGLLPDDLNMGSGTLILDEYIASQTPSYSISVPEDGCEKPIGFDYDQDALDRGPLVPMRFIWTCGVNEDAGSSSAHLNQTVVQEVLAVNLIPNSGFEWSRAEGRVYPLGHERSLHHHDNLAHRFLSREERSGALENVASIDQAPPANQASFVTAPIDVSAGACYLHAAWAKSLRGRGQLAVRWRASMITIQLSGSYLGISPAEDWQMAAQAVQAPGGAVYADALVGYQGTAVPHYFDDHFFVVLPQSPCGEDNIFQD